MLIFSSSLSFGLNNFWLNFHNFNFKVKWHSNYTLYARDLALTYKWSDLLEVTAYRKEEYFLKRFLLRNAHEQKA
jgi:hypothetical protein